MSSLNDLPPVVFIILVASFLQPFSAYGKSIKYIYMIIPGLFCSKATLLTFHLSETLRSCDEVVPLKTQLKL